MISSPIFSALQPRLGVDAHRLRHLLRRRAGARHVPRSRSLLTKLMLSRFDLR